MFGQTIKDEINNDDIHQKVQVLHIEDKMREGRLKWFDHILRRPSNVLLHRCETMVSEDAKRG